MKGGVQVAVDSINTVGAAAKISLKPDKTTLYADGDDASSIEVSLVDSANNFIFAATDTVQFTMTGPGRSLGIASGDWSSAEPFKATSRKLYHGKVLVVIQSTMTPGTIGLTVTSGTLPPATLTITTTASGGAGGSGGTGGTGGSGGASGTGGGIGTAGTSGSGGANRTGGSVGGGGTSGGGGASGAGGTTGSGGGGAGGTAGGGGAGGLGGTIGNGGASATGGSKGPGGANDTGGTIGQGGVTDIGGSIPGGGITATGGSAASNQNGSSVNTGKGGAPASGCSCSIGNPNNDQRTGLLLLGMAAAAMIRRRPKRALPVAPARAGKLSLPSAP
jgi:MYXO-CTERM domain-containing protein